MCSMLMRKPRVDLPQLITLAQPHHMHGHSVKSVIVSNHQLSCCPTPRIAQTRKQLHTHKQSPIRLKSLLSKCVNSHHALLALIHFGNTQ